MLRSSTDLIDSSLFLPHKCSATLLVFNFLMLRESTAPKESCRWKMLLLRRARQRWGGEKINFWHLTQIDWWINCTESKEFNIFLSFSCYCKQIDLERLSGSFLTGFHFNIGPGRLVRFSCIFYFFSLLRNRIDLEFFSLSIFISPALASVCAMKMKNL